MSRRIMRAFKMAEISAVDFPAQVGARATILKRDDSEPYWKRDFTQEQRDRAASSGAALPDGSFPIQNGSDLENAIHAIGRAKDPAKAKAHIIARAKTLGLTSKLPDGWTTSKRIDDMTEAEIQAMLEKAVAKATAPLQAEITTLKADLEKAKKAPPKPADGDDEPDDDDATKKAWRPYVTKMVEKAKAAMQAEFDKANAIAKGDEVLKDDAGNEIRKSVVGEQTFNFMKAQAEKIELAEFGKRAETEIPHLPGEQTLKAKCLRAISKLDKDIREGVEAMLKGGSAAVKSMTKSSGHSNPVANSSEEKLEQLTKDLMAKDTKLSHAEAYTKVLESTEGAELYREISVAKRAAAAR